MRCLVIFAKIKPSNLNPLDEDDLSEATDDDREKNSFIDIKEEPIMMYEDTHCVEEYDIESLLEEDSGGSMQNEEHSEEKEKLKMQKKSKKEVLNSGDIEKLVKPRGKYTPQQKLKIIRFAEGNSNRSAMRKFKINESCIRQWRLQKEKLQKMYHEQQTYKPIVFDRKPRISNPDLEKKIKDWVLEKQNLGTMLKPFEIKATAIEMANPLDDEDPSEVSDDDQGKIAFIDIKEEPIMMYEDNHCVDEYNIESLLVEDSEESIQDEEKEEVKIKKKPRVEVLNSETGKIEVLVKPRKTYTPYQKLEIMRFAEGNSNRSAMRKFDINESCVRQWRLQKETIQKMYHEQQTSNRIVSIKKPRICWPDLEKDLKDWIVENEDRGAILDPYEIKATAIEMAKKRKIPNNNGILSTFIVKFMRRNDMALPLPIKSRKRKNM